MKIDKDQVREILDNMVVHVTPEPVQKSRKEKVWQYVKRTAFIIQTMAICGFVGLLFTEQITVSIPHRSLISLGTATDTTLITEGQANNIKELVKVVAMCEARHPNAVHKELRYKFGYSSYRRTTQSVYFQLKEILSARLCEM